jgi:hypothetical protein
MKTAHEVLADDAVFRMHREEEERRLAALLSRCRSPRWQMPLVAQLIMSAVFVSIFVVVGKQTGDYRGVYVVCGVFFTIGVPAHIWSLRRREKALLALIQAEAPVLFQRLKDETIA